MSRTNFEQLLEAGVHFGHLTRKWNPAMAPYIFKEGNGIHIIDLNKTVVKLDEACEALKSITSAGKKILFVATKKQAKGIVSDLVKDASMPCVVERWPGGMLTNFATIRKAVKKMTVIDKMKKDGTYANLSKRECLQIDRQRAKLEKNLGSISELNRLPAALFVIDVMKEQIAVKEAKRLGIPVFAMVDTNSNPNDIDFVIPSNDDATKSIELIMSVVCNAVKEGLELRKLEKANQEGEAKGGKGSKGAKKGLAKKKAQAEEKIEESEKAEVKEEVKPTVEVAPKVEDKVSEAE